MRNTFLCKSLVLLSAVLLPLAAAEVEPDDTMMKSKPPKTMMVAQGDKLSLSCEMDQPFDYCNWQDSKTPEVKFEHFSLLL